MKKILYILIFLLLGIFAACSEEAGTTSNYENRQPSWQTITATEALSVMEESDNFIILDVRTTAEYYEMRIEGAVLIPYDEIADRAAIELPDKDVIILIYCRTGRRSALAAADLAMLGFSAIYDFGGIIGWPYETIGR